MAAKVLHYQLPFRKSTLHGVEFGSFFSGLCANYYQFQHGWLGWEAVTVRPVPGHQGGSNESSNEGE
jgi:hypothetical protein